ncbi:O-antigen ligase family protein [Noviherbaspirillum galbum]|uniref:O-antigen ligase family protein n=1 Tax=Noviherbaspirillum galbum TaxID=2709383 RepID=A0A6B3STM1_9BURK|nr:O-antigen ligase family protein [Noviherbaspirillum galbum]NEX64024.1 O-antigen ligase family protein [Noviherbaspirillum galbum]
MAATLIRTYPRAAAKPRGRAPSRAGAMLVHAGYLLLFPGFFFYHAAIGTGKLGPVLAGFFSPVALMLLPLLLFYYCMEAVRNPRFLGGTDVAFLLFQLYYFFMVAFQWATSDAPHPNEEHAVALLQFVPVYIIFRMADFHSRGVLLASVAALGGMAAMIFDLSSNGFFDLSERITGHDSATIITYQGFARSFLMTYLVAVPFIKSLPLRLVLHGVSLAALYFNGARSELVGALLAVALVETVLARRRLWVAGGIASLAMLAFGPHVSYLAKMLPGNRILELLDLSTSSSWGSRNEMFEVALRTVGEHPLLGDYGSYINVGGVGSYAHNLISAWVDLGLFGFLFILALMLVPLGMLAADMARRRHAGLLGECLNAFCLLGVTLFLLATVKDFTYLGVPAAIGVFGRYRELVLGGSASPRRTVNRMRQGKTSIEKLDGSAA